MLNEIFFFLLSLIFFTFPPNGFLIEEGRAVHDTIINEDNS